MKNTGKSNKVLIGAQAIQGYLDISEPTFYKFVKLGLPAVVIDNRWYAHADNLDNFFQKATNVRMKQVPNGVE
jgi:hypothetical protein